MYNIKNTFSIRNLSDISSVGNTMLFTDN